MSKAKHNRKRTVIIQRQNPMPLTIIALIILVIILLLSMIVYFVSGAFENLAGFREASIANREPREFSSPLFQDDSPEGTTETTTTGSTGVDTQRSTTNTSTTKETSTSQTTNNNSTQTDNNGSFIGDTSDEVGTIINPTSIPVPTITQTGGLLDSLLGN